MRYNTSNDISNIKILKMYNNIIWEFQQGVLASFMKFFKSVSGLRSASKGNSLLKVLSSLERDWNT